MRPSRFERLTAHLTDDELRGARLADGALLPEDKGIAHEPEFAQLLRRLGVAHHGQAVEHVAHSRRRRLAANEVAHLAIVEPARVRQHALHAMPPFALRAYDHKDGDAATGAAEGHRLANLMCRHVVPRRDEAEAVVQRRAQILVVRKRARIAHHVRHLVCVIDKVSVYSAI